MNTLDRIVLFTGVWAAVILIALGILRLKKLESHEEFVHSHGLVESNPTVTLGVDANSVPANCYATDAWPRLPASDRSRLP